MKKLYFIEIKYLEIHTFLRPLLDDFKYGRIWRNNLKINNLQRKCSGKSIVLEHWAKRKRVSVHWWEQIHKGENDVHCKTKDSKSHI